jgi:hypothetical protein
VGRGRADIRTPNASANDWIRTKTDQTDTNGTCELRAGNASSGRCGQLLDMIDDKLIVETKSTEVLHSNATLQLFGYLCATELEVGLLLHFGREPKFYRAVCENRFKRHRAGVRR